MDDGLFKADLHVHSHHSGQAKHFRFLRARDCYSQPRDVYLTAKKRGMSLVTITDHDSIAGCLEVLDEFPDRDDFIVSEEVTAHVPEFRHSIHIGVYNISEAQHREIQTLRSNAGELVAYLREQGILFALNHFFHDFDRIEHLADFVRHIRALFRIYETRNGAMQREHNQLIAQLVDFFAHAERSYSCIGGSDSHTLRRIGTTFTASYARSKPQFLEDIREGRTFVAGRHANHWAIAADIYGVVLRYYPNALLNRLREFPSLTRFKNVLLSVSLSPLLFLPYAAAVRHTHRERQRIHQITRLLFQAGASPSGPLAIYSRPAPSSRPP